MNSTAVEVAYPKQEAFEFDQDERHKLIARMLCTLCGASDTKDLFSRSISFQCGREFAKLFKDEFYLPEEGDPWTCLGAIIDGRLYVYARNKIEPNKAMVYRDGEFVGCLILRENNMCEEYIDGASALAETEAVLAGSPYSKRIITAFSQSDQGGWSGRLEFGKDGHKLLIRSYSPNNTAAFDVLIGSVKDFDDIIAVLTGDSQFLDVMLGEGLSTEVWVCTELNGEPVIKFLIDEVPVVSMPFPSPYQFIRMLSKLKQEAEEAMGEIES